MSCLGFPSWQPTFSPYGSAMSCLGFPCLAPYVHYPSMAVSQSGFSLPSPNICPPVWQCYELPEFSLPGPPHPPQYGSVMSCLNFPYLASHIPPPPIQQHHELPGFSLPGHPFPFPAWQCHELPGLSLPGPPHSSQYGSAMGWMVTHGMEG
jgi:hypothetical protein